MHPITLEPPDSAGSSAIGETVATLDVGWGTKGKRDEG